MQSIMKLKRSRDEYKHQSILESAIRLFLKYGYVSTTMDAVALEAGVTKQTIYSHYKNKDQLFTEIVTELCRKHTPPDLLILAANMTPEQLLYNVGMAFINAVTSKEGLAATRLVVSEALNHPKLAQYYYESGTKRILHMLADGIDKLSKRGDLNIPNTLSAASYFFSMLKGNYYLRILLNIKPLPTADEKNAHVNECVAVFMRVYGGKSPMKTGNVL